MSSSFSRQQAMGRLELGTFVAAFDPKRTSVALVNR